MTEETKFGISRRTLAKGVAWSVPAVAVAAAAPAYAASDGPIALTGMACKLPGASSNPYKQGYIFEALITNVAGPNPDDVIYEITNMYVNGNKQNFIGFAFVPVDPTVNTDLPTRNTGPSGCSCSNCGDSSHIRFCIPDGTQHRLFLYTDNNGNSATSSIRLEYNMYDCKDTSACGTGVAAFSSSGTPRSNPIQDGGGGSCTLNWQQVFPLPNALPY